MKIAPAYNCLARIKAARLFFALVTVIGAASAQEPASTAPTAATPQEPDYVNSFFLLDSGGSLKPLERETAGVRGKVKAFGYGGAETSYTVPGDHSPVRIPAGTPIAIIVKLANHDVDPANLVDLYDLKSAKGERQLLIGKHRFLGSTKIGAQDQQIPLEFAKYGQSSVKITTAAPLSPGEYAMAVKGQTGMPVAYCFGVDAATK